MKYEFDEEKRSKVEKFTCEDPNFYLNLRWFSMYEQYLFEDFGDLAFRDYKPDTNTSMLKIELVLKISTS